MGKTFGPNNQEEGGSSSIYARKKQRSPTGGLAYGGSDTIRRNTALAGPTTVISAPSAADGHSSQDDSEGLSSQGLVALSDVLSAYCG